MKTIPFIAIILAICIGLAMAQTNPSSTNAVDVEMQLAWPDGIAYISGIHTTDSARNNVTDVAYNGDVSYFNTINWQDTTGGTGLQEAIFQTNVVNDDLYYWPSGQWPIFPDGYFISEPSGVTNGTLEAAGSGAFAFYGSASFTTAFTVTTNQQSVQYNDQAQITMITGGLPGTTGSELYSISAVPLSVGFNFDEQPAQGIWETDTSILPGQFQISSFGNLTDFSTSYDGLVSGTVWAALPLHSQVPLIPNLSGSSYSAVGFGVQGYQLVSQCVATTPANQARTTLGVGEQVNLYFNPSLPINAIWQTTAGSLSANLGPSTTFNAPSNATTATITVSVAGKSLQPLHYTIVAPTGIDHAAIVATNNISGLPNFINGQAGAEMRLNVFFAPTNVSFYRVSIMEIGEDGTNISGYFNQWTPQDLHHNTADHWTTLNQANEYSDNCSLGPLSSPWSAGSFTWPIPAGWQVVGSGVTNTMNGWNQVFSIDGSGTVTIIKNSHSVQRTTNNVITTQ